jgi:N utilization substance protein B
MGKKIPLPHRCKEKSGQNMINRKLVRIKVLQVLYAFGREETSDLLLAEKELETSLRKSYDLYHLLLLLPVDIVRQHERMIEIHRRKFVPTEEDINPNLRLVNNRLVAQLAENIALCRYVKDNHLSWNEEPGFIHTLLNKLLESEIYAQYSLSSPDTYESDRNFWRVFFRTFVCDNEEFDAFLEEKSIYWNDDVEIIESFLLKTLKQFKPDSGADFPLMPMYKDEECRDFARRLLDLTILHGEEYRARIDRLLINWNANRVAGMDRIILQMAIAELLNFPSIPVNVTLNEYIEEAKYYSTPKSSFFINGILDAVVRELRAEKLLPFKS